MTKRRWQDLKDPYAVKKPAPRKKVDGAMDFRNGGGTQKRERCDDRQLEVVRDFVMRPELYDLSLNKQSDALGLNPSTWKLWLSKDYFRKEIKDTKVRVAEGLADKCDVRASQAVDILHDLAADVKLSDNARVKAASKLVEVSRHVLEGSRQPAAVAQDFTVIPVASMVEAIQRSKAVPPEDPDVS